MFKMDFTSHLNSGEWSIARLTLISPYQLVYYDIPYQSGIIRAQIILYQQLALMMGISKLSTMLAFRLGRAFILPSPSKQWGSNVINLNGITQEITLPINIKYAAAAVVTMRSGDFPGYVACPYWSECTQTSIKITPDYEIGQGYAGTAQAVVTWILLSF